MTHNSRVKFLAAIAVLLSVPGAIMAQGCGVSDGPTLYPCDHPIIGRMAKNGDYDGCCDVDPCPGHCINDPCPLYPPPDAGTPDAAEGGSSSCSGECVPLLPLGGWEGPVLLSLTPEGAEASCPVQAPVNAYQAHEGLNVLSASCDTCSCSPSSGTCAPPLTLTASSTPCGNGAGLTAPFDGPAAWDGACTAQDCISQDPSCASSPSVQSLTAGPLVVKEQGCTPSVVVPHKLSAPSWTTAALACRGMVTTGLGCSEPGAMCMPAAMPPDFSLCIFHEGDAICPSPYSQKHLVYAGFEDHRTCSPCACGAPNGSTCAARLDVFKDGACAVPLLSTPISSSVAVCFDLAPAGLALGSKTVTALAYQPGACAPSGGESSGAVELLGSSTFCCLTA